MVPVGTLERVLDANFNRAREALRVLEDLVRFGRDDAPAQARLKALRHRLAALEKPRALRWLAARDSVRDVGRGSDLPGDGGPGALASANFKRLQEALRSIEEAARGRDPVLRRGAAGLRYDAYEAERLDLPPLVRLGRVEPVRLYVLVDPARDDRPVGRVAAAAARGGAGMIQLRMKGASPRDLRRAAREVAAACRGEGALFIANDRPLPGADGVHVGLTDLGIDGVRRRLPADGIVGATTHSMAEARRALAADYLSCGPMFRTDAKPGLAPRGLSYWDRVVRLGRPVFAIGGITAERLPGLRRRGIDRVAVGAGVAGARDVEAAARRFRTLLGS